MKMKFLACLLCCLPMVVNAAIPYRTEQIGAPADSNDGELNDSQALSRIRRFYVGAGYNFSMWRGGADSAVKISGKNNSSFEAKFGIRVYDTFRLEANYYNLKADWDAFSLTGDTIFANAIFDARIDSLYRIFRKQILVPYVGFGAGISWNSLDGAAAENKISPVAAGLAGLSLEFGDRFALDFGYRYLYMFSPKFDVISDFAPTAHQFRAGARVSF
ncbi:MAG: porin family protein [Rickettsiales bacterium]|jgi:opacity protein-like surface antigen|nr:porin family protein [Rickettsiales bacterium]